MDTVLRLNDQQRAELFSAAAQRLGFAPIVIEKDFWTCWTLQQLFTWPELADHLIFKGGTSLSKVWGAIRRFSEDIDVSLGREWLGFGGSQDPEQTKPAKQRREKLDALSKACQEKIRDLVLPGLAARVRQAVGSGGAVSVSRDDSQALIFQYPTVLGTTASGAYVRREVKIEGGARSDDWPAEAKTIQPYVAEAYPDRITAAVVAVRVLSAERTFWEKATILHAEAHRDPATGLKQRHGTRNKPNGRSSLTD